MAGIISEKGCGKFSWCKSIEKEEWKVFEEDVRKCAEIEYGVMRISDQGIWKRSD